MARLDRSPESCATLARIHLSSFQAWGKLLNLLKSASMFFCEKTPTDGFCKTENLLAHENGKSKSGLLQAQLDPGAMSS